MPEIKMSIPHFLTKEEALYRMKRLIGDLRIRYAEHIEDAHEIWQMNQSHFDLFVKGVFINGTIMVEDTVVLFVIEYPAIFSPFREQMERYFRQEAEALLARGITTDVKG